MEQQTCRKCGNTFNSNLNNCTKCGYPVKGGDWLIPSELQKLKSKSGNRLVITKIYAFQFALVMGVSTAITGLILFLIMLPFIWPIIGLFMAMPIIPPELKTTVGQFLIIILILWTLYLFIIGFISGLINAIIYNVTASMTGGIKYQIKTENE